jgi:hypothetical protein
VKLKFLLVVLLLNFSLVISQRRAPFPKQKKEAVKPTNALPEKTIEKQIRQAVEEDKTVTLTVSAQGQTISEAKQNALRDAIEQAFGAFISSNTEILNDELVKDEIVSVSSGNIKSFEVLNQDKLPDERWGVTLKTIVSLDKLTSFIQAKGVNIEVKGGMFALNIKQQLLNEQGEIKAVAEMVGLLHELMQISFDYEIESSDAKSIDSESKNWEIPLRVTAYCNKNIDFCANYFKKTLSSLSLTSTEVETYKSLNKKVFPVNLKYTTKKVEYPGLKQESITFYLRKEKSINIINSLLYNWSFYRRLFAVQSGAEESFGNEKIERIGIRSYLIGDDYLRSLDLRSSRHELNGDDQREREANLGIKSSFADQGLNVVFPKSGKVAGSFIWSDKRTLSQIGKITGYTVKPRGIISKFKYGGYVVWEKGGYGLVVAISDLGKNNWTDAKIMCEELDINGYSDWDLPTSDEFQSIYENLFQIGMFIGSANRHTNEYWNSKEYKDNNSGKFTRAGLSAQLSPNVSKKSYKAKNYTVLAVRTINNQVLDKSDN